MKKLLALVCALALTATLAVPAGGVEAPETPAAGAIVVDYQTGAVYFAQEPDTPRPIASMTKIMSLYLVFEAMEEGRLTPETPIPVSDYAYRVSYNPEYSGGEGFVRHSSVPADTMISLILTASANASVIALAEFLDGTEEAFTARMNQRAQDWGIDAHFSDCTGFQSKGNAVSPRAMAEIARKIIADYPRILDYAQLPGVWFQDRYYATTNKLLSGHVVEGIDGLKTGWTLASGHCFTGTACREGRRVIAVVLDAGSSAGRMSETAKLLEYGFACRWEWEAQWSGREEELKVAVSPRGGAAQAFRENEFVATLSGVEVDAPCAVAVEAGMRRYELGAVPLTQGLTLPFTCGVNYGAQVPLTLAVTFPDGNTVRRTVQVPLERWSYRPQRTLAAAPEPELPLLLRPFLVGPTRPLYAPTLTGIPLKIQLGG